MPPDPTPSRATATFTVSREQFDSVPRRRGIYIVSYVLYVAFIFGARGLQIATMSIPEPVLLASDIAGVVALLIFIHRFMGTMKIMGYEPWMILAMAMLAVMPMPGALFVAYMDRRMATTWDRADPNRPSYRQKPATYE